MIEPSPETIAPPPAQESPPPAAKLSSRLRSAYERLLAEPRRFRFDAAVRVLARASKSSDVTEVARFRTSPGVDYPAADVTAVEPPTGGLPAQVTTPVMTLTGPTGVLPSTETLTSTLRNRSRSATSLILCRKGSHFAQSRNIASTGWPETVPTGATAPRSVAGRFGALPLRYTQPDFTPAVGVEPLLHYSGFFCGAPSLG